MSLQFHCRHCQRQLHAPEKLAGRQARCPGCKNLVDIPVLPVPASPPQVAESTAPDSIALPPGESPSADDQSFDDDFNLAPLEESHRPGIPSLPALPAAPASSGAPSTPPDPPRRFSPRTSSDDSLTAVRDQLHWLFLLALLPLAITIFLPGKPPEERARELANDPEFQSRLENLGEGADIFSILPEGRLPGAHLARSSGFHWVYALASAVLFGACLLTMLPSSNSSPAAIGGLALATGTIGILVLLGFQFIAGATQDVWMTRGHWALIIIFYVVKFIGFSYHCAVDPENGFVLSFLGFTCGVGLCEELVKAIPVIIYFRESEKADWRAVCLVGLASGVGFGISEGITYSSDFYNGVQPGMTYVVRFVSCVSLHAIWSGTVALLVCSNRELVRSPISLETVIFWIGNFLIVPMVLHGLYDTLLKQDMATWALVIAVASFGWFAWLVWQRQVEKGFA